MLRTDSLYLQDLSQFIQTSVKVITELHEVLDVIDCGEVDLQSNAAIISAICMSLSFHEAALCNVSAFCLQTLP